jgi:hypothetical protein
MASLKSRYRCLQGFARRPERITWRQEERRELFGEVWSSQRGNEQDCSMPQCEDVNLESQAQENELNDVRTRPMEFARLRVLVEVARCVLQQFLKPSSVATFAIVTISFPPA